MNFKSIQLNTPRLLLRPISNDDCQSVFDIYSDPAAMQYWSCLPFNDIGQAEELISSAISAAQSNRSLLLAVVLKSSNELIGTMSLFNLHAESKRAEIGYLLAPSHWRQGLMSEALSAFIEFCFEELDLNRLEADIDPNNTASSAILKKFGFEVEGYLKDRWIVAGNVTDSEIYGLLRKNRSK